MLLHLNDNKLISYRSKDVFCGAMYRKRHYRTRSFGDNKEKSIIEALEHQ